MFFPPQIDFSSSSERLLFIYSPLREMAGSMGRKKIWPIKQIPRVKTVKLHQHYSCRSPTRCQIPLMLSVWGGGVVGLIQQDFLIKSKNINYTLCYESGKCCEVSDWSGWQSIKKNPWWPLLAFCWSAKALNHRWRTSGRLWHGEGIGVK